MDEGIAWSLGEVKTILKKRWSLKQYILVTILLKKYKMLLKKILHY
jgi:hypothetical protein